METIIGLLVILLPVIFKAIEKKLQQSGPQPANSELPDLSEFFGELSVETERQEPAPEPVSPVFRAEPLRKEEALRKEPKRKPVLLEEPERKREKIDTKKLVIYSEIMKPKYNE